MLARVVHAQTPIGFSAVLMRDQLLVSGAAQGPIRLEDKVLARKAASFPGPSDDGQFVALLRLLPGFALAERGCKFGGTHWVRLEEMAQFQPEVPHPLGHDLPGFLPAGGVRAPATWSLFLVLIGKRWLKSPAMQIQFDDISGSKCPLRQGGKEEFVDHSCPCDANGTLLLTCWMHCHHHPAPYSFGSDRNLRAIVETAHRLAFRALLELIGRQMQTRLNSG